MRAVVFAGGKGTRLSPHTDSTPKPLVELKEKETILGHVLSQLSRYSFDHVTIAVHHFAEQIIDYCGDGSRWNIRIDYSREETPLGTIGPLTLIPDLPDDFLTINGDTLTDLNYGALLRDHTAKKKDITVSAYKRAVKIDFGVFELDESSHLRTFKEKPTHDAYVAMGVNCYKRRVIEELVPNAPYGFDELMRDSLSPGRKVLVHEHDGFWLDVGRPEDYHDTLDNYYDMRQLI